MPPPWLPRPMFGRPGLSMLMPSKTAPRSTKNGSSTGPTNVLPPPLTGATAPLEIRRRSSGSSSARRCQARRRRRSRSASSSSVALLVVRLAVEVVRLDEVDVRIVRGRDGRRRVQERVRVAELLAELPPVRDVLATVAGVVDLDVVAGLRIELAEVRATGRLLERDPVGDHGQAAWSVLRREGVDVGVVRGRVGQDPGRLSMARAEDGRGNQRRSGQRGHDRHAEDMGSAHADSLRSGCPCLRARRRSRM